MIQSILFNILFSMLMTGYSPNVTVLYNGGLVRELDNDVKIQTEG
ncbi:hypothetical protein V7146_00630 [Gottfriedia acidiceleris]